MTWTAEDDSTTVGIIGALVRHGYRAAGQLASIEMLASPDVLPIVRGLVWGLCMRWPAHLLFDYQLCLDLGLERLVEMVGPVWVEDCEDEERGETWLLLDAGSRRDDALDVLRDAAEMGLEVELAFAQQCMPDAFTLRFNGRLDSPRTRLAAGLLEKAGLVCGGW